MISVIDILQETVRIVSVCCQIMESQNLQNSRSLDEIGETLFNSFGSFLFDSVALRESWKFNMFQWS